MMISTALAMLLMQATTAAPAAQSAPPSLTKAEMQARTKRTFDMMDANKDGVVDTAEATKARDTGVALRQKARTDRVNEVFGKLDTDKNGSISRQEFEATARPVTAPANIPWLEGNDSNKDGRVTIAEANAQAQAEFARLDTSKDGVISVQEARAARRDDDSED